MKKIFSLIAAALFAQAAFAQVCAFQVDGNIITFDGKEVDIHEAGAVLEKAQTEFQDIFVYVTSNTPLGFVNDLKTILEDSSTAGVVFMNLDPGMYGPLMAYEKNFIEMEMLHKSNVATFRNTNEDPWNFFLEGAAPDDYAYNSTRMNNYLRTPNNSNEWTNNFDGVVLNLAYQTPIGALYTFDHLLNGENVPYMNVVYHTEGTPLCPERWFTLDYTGLEEYEFPTIQPVEPVEYNGKDLQSFSETYQPTAFLSDLEGQEAAPGKGRAIVEFEITPLGTVQNVKIQRAAALPGLNEVIIDYLYGLPCLWKPQFVKGHPVNVKVSCPIYGEISQW